MNLTQVFKLCSCAELMMLLDLALIEQQDLQSKGQIEHFVAKKGYTADQT